MSLGSTPGGRQVKRPKQTGQLSYDRAAQEGIRMTIVCNDHPEAPISKEDFVEIQRAIGRLADRLPEEEFTPRLFNTYWAKGVAIMVCQD
jgi:hypothetical protein